MRLSQLRVMVLTGGLFKMTELRKTNPTDWLIEVAKGNVLGHSIITKFGHASVSTTLVPITSSLAYPSPSAAAALEFVSDSTDDATGGIGATKIIYEGLDSTWAFVSGEIDTDGTTPVALPDELTRLTRWYVSESGSYASLAQASYVGNLTIREAGVGATWSTINNAAPFPAQSEIGVISIPIGTKAYLISKHIFTDTGKTADLYLLARENANDIVAPYSGVRRLQEREIGVSGNVEIAFEALKGPYTGPADIGFIGKVTSGSADISVEFAVLVVEDGF